ncbi:hypothetical protein [Laspinema olomoucense]|uniref:Uncharacterized protein n=1 Tax=Laspinema olomoucense D3b TaxID=2953688 RepID=A0ABT2NBK6_9CYAN|nr:MULTISPECIES: hypothetical protein [unclassified Laspinema]MCT7980073.1 hypothetical protein [Laspinema sp. D3b]MCT7990812.1 hypothetical protein [Laspinema sp. D3a]MCT7996407.1 hypothetical protein [Laspinema sp. D3c]
MTYPLTLSLNSEKTRPNEKYLTFWPTKNGIAVDVKEAKLVRDNMREGVEFKDYNVGLKVVLV